MTAPSCSIVEACDDPELFGQWFRDRSTWAGWLAFIAALFGHPLTPDQTELYAKCTGRLRPPLGQFKEGWLICGRRAGKSFVLALIAVFLSCFKSYADYLGPGERATVAIIASDRQQARTILRYVKGLIGGTPMLNELLAGHERADGLDLTNSVTIEIRTASFKTSRGYTFVAVLCDEAAFWPTDDSAEPDFAVLDALRPGMATIPGAMLLVASSPYGRRGALWDAFKSYFGTDDPDVLVWKADTRTMNPTVSQALIDRAMARDPASAAAEYGAEFRSDLEAFVSREVVEAAIDPSVYERAPIEGINYAAFVDPSGGGHDSMTLAIAHCEDRVLILDAVRERIAPFAPEGVVGEFAELLKSYGVSQVRGDRYAGEWPREAFQRHGVSYLAAEKPKSDLYRDALPELNSRNVALLDLSKLTEQLVSLERRTSRGGRDIIDHPPSGKDDVANAVCGALLLVKPSLARNIDLGGLISVDAGEFAGQFHTISVGWDLPHGGW
ncbi:hypothetical protein [Bradyrhizobium sp. JYMT SZCCT0428]|uniref:hypothetical protein n=1 Tax=Bradyrhizobium sp. JYMT SZCCT0428 TaxID=2807673 RepID=UPI001BA6291C|nr:hypothetical protein [Bradyrhizobium sp. JYMT SZCCT0428]MBR1156669.1 hypothetical protein [Bradyrhizobium sp. JYMT SZCCT0428]